MRDLAKSFMSCGWAMSVFGAQQVLNVIKPAAGVDPCGKTAKAFDDVTNTAVNTLDGSMKSAFQAGANLQAGVVDLMFGGMLNSGLDPGRWMKMGTEALHRIEELGKQAARATADSAGTSPGTAPSAGPVSSGGPGWGPMPR